MILEEFVRIDFYQSSEQICLSNQPAPTVHYIKAATAHNLHLVPVLIRVHQTMHWS